MDKRHYQTLSQFWVRDEPILIWSITPHVGTLRGDRAQLDHERVQTACLFEMVQRRASASSAIPVASSTADVTCAQVQTYILLHSDRKSAVSGRSGSVSVYLGRRPT